MNENDPAQSLKNFQPQHDFFVGIDSDGCVFDTMEIKQKECFIPNTVKIWNLQSISKYVREAGEFVNLYSRWRGINRWPALIKVFDLLTERDEIKKRNIEIPPVKSLRDWIGRETKLGNPALKTEVEKTGDPILTQALLWSETINADVAEMVKGVSPFPYVRQSLQEIIAHADAIVVSQTPCEALIREWQEHKIDHLVRIIAGQEMGTKTEHLRFATQDRYQPNHVLMIGDAPGDLKAARANNVLFYPVNPGHEEQSWQRFHEESFDKFINGQYAGSYQDKLIAEFEKYLPSQLPWEKDTHHD